MKVATSRTEARVKALGLINHKTKKITPDAKLAPVTGARPITTTQLRAKVKAHTKE